MNKRIFLNNTQLFKFGIVILATFVLGMLLMVHWSHLNGPWYWKWRWQRIDGLILYPSMFIAISPFYVAQYLYQKKKLSCFGALTLIMLSTFFLEIISIGTKSQSFSLIRIMTKVEDPVITSSHILTSVISQRDQFIKKPHFCTGKYSFRFI